jgi:predicted kinase
MEAVILIGIQGSGKSTFYKERLFNTHVRINLDMLKTPRRERLLLEACLAARQPFVVDKMNLTREKRRPYIDAAKAAGFRVIGYMLDSNLDACKRRNAQRPPNQVVPIPGVQAAHRNLEAPAISEGFDELHRVSIDPDGRFVVEKLARDA